MKKIFLLLVILVFCFSCELYHFNPDLVSIEIDNIQDTGNGYAYITYTVINGSEGGATIDLELTIKDINDIKHSYEDKIFLIPQISKSFDIYIQTYADPNLSTIKAKIIKAVNKNIDKN